MSKECVSVLGSIFRIQSKCEIKNYNKEMKNKSKMAPELVYRNETIGTPVTIYSTLELSERIVVLGQTPRNLRDNPGGAAKRNQSSPGWNPGYHLTTTTHLEL